LLSVPTPVSLELPVFLISATKARDKSLQLFSIRCELMVAFSTGMVTQTLNAVILSALFDT